MILYKDNPNLPKLNVITTVNGDKEYRRNCRFIKGEYHLVGRDCFKINGKYYRKSSELITFDNEVKEWTLKDNPNLMHGIVSFKKGVPVMGHFSKNVYNNCTAYTEDKGKVVSINPDILIENGFFEDLANGIYHPRNSVSDSSYKKMTTIRSEKNYTNKGYNIEDNAREFKDKKLFFKNYNPKLSKDVKAYAKYLGAITYGMELETSAGNVPEYIQNRTGLVACRDGSISSAEYVTVPMEGVKGLSNIYTMSEELSKRCNIDIHCSFHIHIGTLPLSRDYISALYILSYRMQDDMFKMFPYFKTEPANIKRKNYNQKLGKLGIHPLVENSKVGYQEYIKDVYEKIFMFLSDGQRPDGDFNRGNRQHPQNQKWNRVARYYWINLINTIFSTRETVEFRLHTATLNAQKMVNWLFICNAICKYAEKHMKDIFSSMSKISMEDVLNYYKDTFKEERASFLSEYLIAYYQERCKLFKKDYENGDYISEHELTKDKNYSFRYKGVSDLF